MLVEARDVEDFEQDIPTRNLPARNSASAPVSTRNIPSDEIEKMTLLYEGTLSEYPRRRDRQIEVLRVTDTAVILDVGFKSEGAVAIDEFKIPRSLRKGRGRGLPRAPRDQEGAVVLSKKKGRSCASGRGSRSAEKDEGVKGTLVKKIKGGVVVDLMGVERVLARQPDRAAAGSQHRRAARSELRV